MPVENSLLECSNGFFRRADAVKLHKPVSHWKGLSLGSEFSRHTGRLYRTNGTEELKQPKWKKMKENDKNTIWLSSKKALGYIVQGVVSGRKVEILDKNRGSRHGLLHGFFHWNILRGSRFCALFRHFHVRVHRRRFRQRFAMSRCIWNVRFGL